MHFGFSFCHHVNSLDALHGWKEGGGWGSGVEGRWGWGSGVEGRWGVGWWWQFWSAETWEEIGGEWKNREQEL